LGRVIRDAKLGRVYVPQFGTRICIQKLGRQVGTRIYTQNYIEFTKIHRNSQQNTKKSQKITENHIEIQKIHNISMKFTYNPTKKTSLGGSCIEKYIYIYIYYAFIHSNKKKFSLATKKTKQNKKNLAWPQKKIQNKKNFFTNKKNFFQKKKNFSKKNLLQNKKKIHSFKEKNKKNFHQNIKIHRFNQNIKKSMKNEVHPDPPKPPF